MNWLSLPGGEMMQRGLDDYRAQVLSDEALVVSIVRSRLTRHQFATETRAYPNAHEQLYTRLAARHGDGAHSAYNALLRRAMSLCAALDQMASAGDTPGL